MSLEGRERRLSLSEEKPVTALPKVEIEVKSQTKDPDRSVVHGVQYPRVLLSETLNVRPSQNPTRVVVEVLLFLRPNPSPPQGDVTPTVSSDSPRSPSSDLHSGSVGGRW